MRTLLLTACLASWSTHALAQSTAALLPDPSLPTSDYAYHPSTGEQPPPVDLPSDTNRRTGSAWMVRAGSYSGTGKATFECDGPDCGAMPPAESYDEHGALALSVDWLGSASRNLRLGASFSLIPTLTTQLNGQRFELGTVFGTDFVVEGVFDLSKKTALTLRGSAGVSVLVPSGELDDLASANADSCAEYYDCEADPGPYLGVQAALGAGVLYNLGRVGLRVDFQAQAYSFRTLETKVAGSEASLRFSGVRPMVLAGIEL